MAAPAPAAAGPRDGGSALTRKVGPLQTWVWLLVITLAAAGWYLWQKRNGSSSPSTSTTATGQQANANGVPDIILQDYGSPVTQTVTTPPAGSTPPPAPPPRGGTPAPPAPKPAPAPKKAAPPKPAPPPEPIFNAAYAVKKGQTLAAVAQQFGITREQLAHANGLGTGAGLRTGQVLHVPSPAPGGKPNPAK